MPFSVGSFFLFIFSAIVLLKIKMITMTPQSSIQTPYTMDPGYDKNSRPSERSDLQFVSHFMQLHLHALAHTCKALTTNSTHSITALAKAEFESVVLKNQVFFKESLCNYNCIFGGISTIQLYNSNMHDSALHAPDSSSPFSPIKFMLHLTPQQFKRGKQIDHLLDWRYPLKCSF